MPLCACSNRPCRVPTAPVNAPRAWPNSSASSSVSGIALQLIATKRFARRGAAVVNRPRGELLAGAGFAGDQHRARRGRDDLEQLKQVAHHPAAADEAVDAVALFELRSQVGVLRLETALLERRVQNVQQRVELERLGDEVGRALLDGLDRILHRPEAGDDDGDDLGVARERGVEHLPAVDARQAQVGDDDVEGELGQALQRLFPAVGLFDRKAVVGQPLGDGFPQRLLVIDDQQMFLAFRHLSRVDGILTHDDSDRQSRVSSRQSAASGEPAPDWRLHDC